MACVFAIVLDRHSFMVRVRVAVDLSESIRVSLRVRVML